MLNLKKAMKIICCVTITLIVIEFFMFASNNNFDIFLRTKLVSVANLDRKNIKFNHSFDLEDENTKISWENETQIKLDAERVGPGEQGKPYMLTDPEDIQKNEELFKIEGFYVIVSDQISVERALPDKRPKA